MIRKENRIHPRLHVRMPGEYRVGEGPWQRGHIQDLSAGGATLITMVKVPAQTSLRIRFRLPEEPDTVTPIEVETLVLRAETLSAVGGNFQYREALHFLDLVGQSYQRVRRFVFDRREEAGP